MRLKDSMVIVTILMVLHNDLYVARDVRDESNIQTSRAARRRLRHLQRQRKRENRHRDSVPVEQMNGSPDLAIPTTVYPLEDRVNHNKSSDYDAARRHSFSPGDVTSRTSRPVGRSFERIRKGRVRAKEWRIFQIQLELHGRLRMGSQLGFVSDQGITDPSELVDLIPNPPESGHGTRRFTPRLLHASCGKPARADSSWYDNSHLRLFFEIERGLIHEGDPTGNLTSAVLKLYKAKDSPLTRVQRLRRANGTHDQNTSPLDDTLTVTIYQYLKAPRRDKTNRADRTSIIDAKPVEKQHEGYIQLDIKKAVKFWSDYPRRNYGLIVKVEDSGGNYLNASQMFQIKHCDGDTQLERAYEPHTFPSSDKRTEPAIIIVTEQLPPVEETRRKRHVAVENSSTAKRSKTRRRQCSITEMKLSFEELGLDWIIQPQTFTYRTCRGTCSRTPKRRAIRDRYGKNLDRYNAQEDSIEEKQCCGPTAMSPLSVIHIDDKAIIHYSILHDFIVTECGCRS